MTINGGPKSQNFNLWIVLVTQFHGELLNGCEGLIFAPFINSVLSHAHVSVRKNVLCSEGTFYSLCQIHLYTLCKNLNSSSLCSIKAQWWIHYTSLFRWPLKINSCVCVTSVLLKWMKVLRSRNWTLCSQKRSTSSSCMTWHKEAVRRLENHQYPLSLY